jgi:hypothetical protein
MEADISTLRKTGHFYFALTESRSKASPTKVPRLQGRRRSTGATITAIARQKPPQLTFCPHSLQIISPPHDKHLHCGVTRRMDFTSHEHS